jgi:predicted sulfurtransferase
VTARRWPLEPLAALMGGMGAMERSGFDSGECYRAKRVGLSDLLADRWAVRCGVTPMEVWADWCEAMEVECAAADCTERFVPNRWNHRYHSPACTPDIKRRARQAESARRVDAVRQAWKQERKTA